MELIPKVSSNRLRQTIYFVAAQAAMYSASVVLIVVHFCDVEFLAIKLSVGLNKYPFRDFRFQCYILRSLSHNHIVYIANGNDHFIDISCLVKINDPCSFGRYNFQTNIIVATFCCGEHCPHGIWKACVAVIHPCDLEKSFRKQMCFIVVKLCLVDL